MNYNVEAFCDSTMKILVTGSAKGLASNSLAEFANDCTKLGRALAKMKHCVMICAVADMTADRYVCEGVCEVLKNDDVDRSSKALILMSAFGDTSGLEENASIMDKLRNLERSGAVSINRVTSNEWARAFWEAINDADALFVISSQRSENVHLIVSFAEVRQIPVISCPRYSGYGKELFNFYSLTYTKMGVSQNLYSSLEESLEELKLSELLTEIVEKFSDDRTSQLDLLRKYRHDVLIKAKENEKKAKSYRDVSFYLGMGAAVAAGTAGAGIISSQAFDVSPLGIVAGGISLVAAALSALRTAQPWDQLIKAHAMKAAEYQSISRDIDQCLAQGRKNAGIIDNTLTRVMNRMDELTKDEAGPTAVPVQHT